MLDPEFGYLSSIKPSAATRLPQICRYLITIAPSSIWPLFLTLHQFHLKARAPASSSIGLTHWGQVTHICTSKLTIIGSDSGLSPVRRQAITWSNADLLSIEPLWKNFSEIQMEIQNFSFMKMHWKMSSGKWRPFCFSPWPICSTSTFMVPGPMYQMCHQRNIWPRWYNIITWQESHHI